MPTDIHEQLTKYLTDAHSIEEQALAQLRTAPDVAGDPELAEHYRRHLAETERQEELVRGLLEERDASPSRVKDAVMAVGGKGFLLFARANPDTPGKLHAHALSYEALEAASYELLRRVADLADEPDVAEAATRIRDEELEMMARLESGYDRAVEASLRSLEPDDLDEQLRAYLADAHALEEQAIALLERAPDIVEQPALARIFAEHLDESRRHAELVEARLGELGGDPSTLKDAALRLGALNWGAFFRGHPDTPGKLTGFAYAFEHLEIGGYEQLRRVAGRAGDGATAALAARILGEEHAAGERLWAALGTAAESSLEAVGVHAGS